MGLDIETPWTAAGKVLSDLIDRLVPDKAEAEKQKLATLQALQSYQMATLQASVAVDTAQAATNTAEASSTSRWNSGWRPGAGWLCVAGLCYSFILQPLLSWTMAGLMHWPPAPVLDTGVLLTLLASMLGISTQRTIERINGVIPPGK